MKLKQIVSAASVHFGACLIAFLAMGSAAPEATSAQAAKVEKPKPAPTPLGSVNSLRTEDPNDVRTPEALGTSSGATSSSKN